MGDLDQFEICFVQRSFKGLITVPVAISLFYDNAALQQQSLQHRLDIELLVFRITHAKSDIFKVTEYRHADIFLKCGHKVCCLSIMGVRVISSSRVRRVRNPVSVSRYAIPLREAERGR